MDKFRLALLHFIFKTGTESQRSRETEITQGRITSKTEKSTLKRKGIYDMKKKNRTLCPREAAFRGLGNSRSYTHSGAARWMQDESRGWLMGTWIILSKLFKMQPHTAVQQPSYGGTEVGLGQANKWNWESVPCAVFPSKVSTWVSLISELYKPQNDAAQHPQNSEFMV